MKSVNNLNLNELAAFSNTRFSALISSYLTEIPSLDLKTAMTYTVSNGGKRLRPQLIYATGAIFSAPLNNMDIASAAVELIHTYSLIHDDLPCMDNADLRRGKPACHKAFNEAIAVLAGDALHTLAMHIIAHHPAQLPAERRLQMMTVLTTACGPYGMAAGQALDMTMLNDKSLDIAFLENIYQLKTGALFSACIELARIGALDDDEVNQRALRQFGDNIGLAFQIQDDILDIQSSTETLGKPQQHDSKNNKMTYPALVGVNAAKLKVEALYEAGLEAINYLGQRAQLLRDLTTQMLDREF